MSRHLLEITGLLVDSGCLTFQDLRTLETKWTFGNFFLTPAGCVVWGGSATAYVIVEWKYQGSEKWEQQQYTSTEPDQIRFACNTSV